MYLGEKLIVRIDGKSSLRINEVLSHTQHIEQLPQQDSAHSTFSLPCSGHFPRSHLSA